MCLNEFTQKYSTLQQVCSPICARKFNTKKEVDKRVTDMKRQIKSSAPFDTLQTLINTIVRLLDRGHACITSNAPYGSYVVNAGHYFSRGSNATLRYNLLNIFNQCQVDNDRKGGKGSNYSLRLKEIFGEGVRDEIEGLVKKYPSIHLTKMEAKDKCKIAGEIIRELEAHDIELSTEYRILVRRKLNERIGIYL